jgi:hypothetical protein
LNYQQLECYVRKGSGEEKKRIKEAERRGCEKIERRSGETAAERN